MVRGSVVSTVGADVCAAILGIFSIIWIVILAVPTGWNNTHVWMSFKFQIGLYSVYTRREGLGTLACLAMKSICDSLEDGSSSLADMQQRLCVLPNEFCDDFKNLYWGSMFMIMFGVLIVIMHWLGAGFLIYFFHVDGNKVGYAMVRVILILIPCFVWLALLLYFCLSVGFGDSGSGVHYGVCFFLAVFSGMVSIVPVLVFEMCANQNAQKVLNVRADVKAEREFQEGQARDMEMRASLAGGYGQGPPGYGAQPGYGAPPPGYGGPPGGYGGPPPGYGGQPGYGGPPPGYGGQPGYGYR